MDNGKTKFATRVEVVTNLSIIVVALIDAVVLLKTYLIRPPGQSSIDAKPSVVTAPASENQRRDLPKGPAEGTQITLPDVDWGGSNQTILLALSNQCHFCSESAPFYQR